MAFLPISEDPLFNTRSKVFSSSNIQNDDSIPSAINFASSGTTNIKVPTSVQYLNVPNLVMSTTGPPSSIMQQKLQNVQVKQEPDSPHPNLSTQNVQNPPLSKNTYTQDSPNNLMTTKNYDNEDHENYDKMKKLEEEYTEDMENKAFVLAPTPAQLGRAPLQRRLHMGNII